jgi:hypothetical protein
MATAILANSGDFGVPESLIGQGIEGYFLPLGGRQV